jgi:hypothetical protein
MSHDNFRLTGLSPQAGATLIPAQGDERKRLIDPTDYGNTVCHSFFARIATGSPRLPGLTAAGLDRNAAAAALRL